MLDGDDVQNRFVHIFKNVGHSNSPTDVDNLADDTRIQMVADRSEYTKYVRISKRNYYDNQYTRKLTMELYDSFPMS